MPSNFCQDNFFTWGDFLISHSWASIEKMGATKAQLFLRGESDVTFTTASEGGSYFFIAPAPGMRRRYLALSVAVICCLGSPASCSREPLPNDAARLLEAAQKDGGLRTPLSTQDRYIVDAGGERFKLAGVNWYGASDAFDVPGGLDRASLPAIVALIKAMGFNTVRLPFSNAMIHADHVDNAHVAANPSLFGKRPLEVFDAVIEELTRAGIAVIINNHTTHAMWCCGYDNDGLWQTSDHNEGGWIADWREMALRYRHNPLVVGADLRNEIRITKWQGTILPQFPHWGRGPNDWRAAAQRGAAAIQEVHPDLLIIVEGINAPRYHLRGVFNDPIHLAVPGKLVYAVHNYGFTKPGLLSGPTYGEMSFEDFSRLMDQEWGYVLTPHQAYTAPVWVSEFGIGPGDDAQKKWFGNIIHYLHEKDADWAMWAVNSGPKASGEAEHFGLVTEDWSAVTEDFRLQELRSIMAPQSGPGIEKGWEQRPENHLDVLLFADWDSDHRRMRDDWAPRAYKATCREGGHLIGFSHGLRAGRSYSHAALCSDFGPTTAEGTSSVLIDNGKDSTSSGSHTARADWAKGANKLECPMGSLVTGLAQSNKGGSYRLAGLLCTISSKGSSYGACAPLPLDDLDHRLSPSGGEWDVKHAKTQCADQGFIAGIALRNGVPAAMLCCL